jgi:hypothetical protein
MKEMVAVVILDYLIAMVGRPPLNMRSIWPGKDPYVVEFRNKFLSVDHLALLPKQFFGDFIRKTVRW